MFIFCTSNQSVCTVENVEDKLCFADRYGIESIELDGLSVPHLVAFFDVPAILLARNKLRGDRTGQIDQRRPFLGKSLPMVTSPSLRL